MNSPKHKQNPRITQILQLIPVVQKEQVSSKTSLLHSLEIPLYCFQYFRSGSDHVLFNCPGTIHQKNVFVFRRRKEFTQNIFPVIQILFQQAYHLLLGERHLLGRYIVSKQFYQTKKFTTQAWEHLQSLCEKGEKLERETNIFISPNILNQQQYQTIVQFKPKTPLPDVYTSELLEQIAGNFQMDVEEVKEKLKLRPSFQKMRWFKKNIWKDNGKQSKLGNQNPLAIFNLEQLSQYCPKFSRTKLYKHLPQEMCQEEEHQINQAIFKSLRQTRLLQQIYELQALYFRGIPSKLLPVIKQLQSSVNQQNQSKILKELRSIKETQAPKLQDIFNFMQNFDGLENYSSGQQQKAVVEVFRYLVGLTWKDVSVICCFKDKQVTLYLVDTDLKKIEKIEQNAIKDRLFLKNYFQKVIIPQTS